MNNTTFILNSSIHLLKKSSLAILISSFFATGAFAESLTTIQKTETFVSSTVGNAIPSIFTYSALTPFSSPVNVTDTFAAQNAFQLESGSLTFRFKNSEATQLTALLGVSNSKKDNDYILFYVNRKASGDAFGIEIRKSTNLIPNNQLVTADIARNDSEFTTVTYTFDKLNKKIMIYVNGTLQKTYHGDTKFFKDIEGLDAAYVGRTKRASGTREMTFTGNVYYAGAEPKVLTAEEVKAEHDKLTKNYILEYNAYLENEAANIKYAEDKHNKLGSYMSTKEPLFQKDQGNAKNYRIPALLTTKDGIVIAAIDKRHQHAGDWGNIDTAIRRSLDGGKTWQDDQVIIDLASQTYGAANAAFLIDPLMLQDKTSGRIFMLVDMFPETQGFFGINRDHSSEGTGYKKIKDNYYRVLTGADGEQYTVRENGIVYNEDHQPTEYKVIVEGDSAIGFKDLGDLYHGAERLGNVFLQTAQQGSDAAPLKVQITSYLWLTHSDDNGATWSNPVDLTPQVKADWMRFLGTGPGTGIQLKDGTLIMPVYYTNSNNKQSAALIISKDGGNTWERGESPNDRRLASTGGSRLLNDDWKQLTESQVVELDNGDLKLFSRNLSGRVQISTSKDSGYTWQKTIISDDILLDPYSQMSVIKYSKKINGKEYLVFANPHSASRSRVNGMVWLGEVQDDGSIKWKYNTTITTGNYGYNSLTELPDGSIGLLYEESAEKIQYVRLNLQEIVWSENRIYRDKRSTEHLEVSLTSDRAETFYKIGDGEMVKVGTGENAAKLVIEEGIATLKQTADDNSKVQAYAEVTVKQGATVRLADDNQLPYDKLILEGGNVDLNGNTITVDKATSDTQTTGLYSDNITGHFINSAEQMATLVYNAGGQHTINGNLGGVAENNQPNMNLVYNPDGENANLTIDGITVLNEIDVKSGKITYKENTQHFSETTRLGANATLALESGTTVVAKAVTLAQDSTLSIHSAADKLVSLHSENLSGAGNLSKTGAGVFQLSGNTKLDEGNIEIKEGVFTLDDATINAKTFTLANGATLSGNGNITSAMTWQAGAVISPHHSLATAVAERTRALPFEANVLSFTDIINQGASVVLRVNNISDEIKAWQHDFVKITDNVTNNSDKAIPVAVNLLGTENANSDINGNGFYDNNEGISLIQIGGEAKLGVFELINGNVLSNDLYSYTLVAFDKGASLASENKVNDYQSNFYDYRLQTQLIDSQGNTPSTRITVAAETATPTTTAVTETTTVATPTVGSQAAASSSASSSLASTPTAPETVSETINYRAQINPLIPSHIVASDLALTHNNMIYQNFERHSAPLLDDGQNMFVAYLNGKTDYKSSAGFLDYGYNAESRYNGWMVGGKVWQSEQQNRTLHLAVNHGKYHTTPQAADGTSRGEYKTYGANMKFTQQFGDAYLALDTGYQHHKGDISANNDSATLVAKALRIGSEVGYRFSLGNIDLIPRLNVQLQRMNLKSNSDLFKIQYDNINAVTTNLGLRTHWNLDNLTLGLDTYYQHNSSSKGDLLVRSAIAERSFTSGGLGNSINVETAAEYRIMPKLSLGISVGYQHKVSHNATNSRNVSANIKYTF
ncbi:exo-alpha-sialidase [Testudinibacter sp. TR-2022]|uniref:exo-alpha-sialidase n=1 Tax=Testudinibacter sp. TR-2022 TaxID=2585029 RepID=UPI00159BA252|nr:exo-alpha-sialidase [Testudinibacter sp. TR-2022]